MIDILNQIFTPDISNNIFKFLIHPTAEIIKPLFCQTCYRRKLKCSRCDRPTCFSCEMCGSISESMYCEKCFDYYKDLLFKQQNLIVIHNITHFVNIHILN